MKQMFERNEVMLFSLTSLICMKKSGNVLTNLVYHSSIGHTFALNTIVNCWMNVVTKRTIFSFKLKKKKSEYWHSKTLRRKQTRSNKSTWP